MKLTIHTETKPMGINTEHITHWIYANLVNRNSGEQTEGFCLHLFMVNGKELLIYHDQGGEELLRALLGEAVQIAD